MTERFRDRRSGGAAPTRRPDPARRAQPLVVLEKVNKHFGDAARAEGHRPDRRRAARSSSSSARPGSGKSTLCRTINRLETDRLAARITIDGQPLPAEGKELARLRADVGMVFQSFNLFAHKTVLENVTLGPIKVRGLPKPEAERARA